MQRVEKGTLLGTAVPVIMFYKAIPQTVPGQQIANQPTANFVYKVYEQMKIDSTSNDSSSSEFELCLLPIRRNSVRRNMKKQVGNIPSRCHI